MRLHLPLSLFAALMACYSLAHADYTWNGGSGTKTANDWNASANWNGSTLTEGKGPNTDSSGAWTPIYFSKQGTISFSGLSLNGWNLRMNVTGGTQLTMQGTITKYQSGDGASVYFKVDETSKLVWNIENDFTGNNSATVYFDVKSYKGLELRYPMTSSGKAFSALNISLGTAGSIYSTIGAVFATTGTTITFSDTALLQNWESRFSTNSGQYTSTTSNGYVLYTRRLWEAADGVTTAVGGTLGADNTFTVYATGATLTSSNAALTASADDANKYFLYSDDAGNIFVSYVLAESIIATWNNTANGTWSTTSNWDVNADPKTAGYVAKFTGGSNATVTVDEDVSPSTINVAGGSYTFSGSGKITGTTVVIIDGGSTLTMDLANDNYGATNIDNGTLIVGTSGKLGTGAVTVASGSTLQINKTGNTTDVTSGGITLNGGTLAFTVGDHTLSTTLGGSDGKITVSGSGTSLTIDTNQQTATSLTTVSNGATLTLDRNVEASTLYGDLNVNGSTLKTVGDALGYENNDNFGTLTLTNSTWNITGGNFTLGKTTIVLNNSTVTMNLTGTNGGMDVHKGATIIKTDASATGMSKITPATDATGTASTNSVNLRGGTACTFDIARSTEFSLDTTNTADLKLEVAIANKEGSTLGFTKQGDGVLQLTKTSSSYTGKTTLSAGTILLTDDGTLGSGEVAMSSGSYLTLNYTAAKSIANVLSGTGTVTQKGSGTVTITGENSYAGTTAIEAGTLAAGNAKAFGTSTINLGATATLAVGAYALTNAVTIADATVAATETITASTGGTVGNLTVGKKNSLTVNGGLTLASGSTFTLDEEATLKYTSDGTATAALDLSAHEVVLKFVGENITTATDVVSLSLDSTTAKVEATSLTLKGTTTDLDLTNAAVVTLLTQAKEDKKIAAVKVTSTELKFTDDTYKQQLLAQSSLLAQLGYAVQGISGGSIILNGEKVDSSDIYVVVSDEDKTYPHALTTYTALDPYKAVVLDAGQTLAVELDGEPDTMTAEDALQVRNLLGVSGSTLSVKNTEPTETALVLLDNSSLSETEPVTGKKVGTDTTMEGSIKSEGNVVFLKTGAGKLTVSGAVDADTLQVEEGTVVLSGNAELDLIVLNQSADADTAQVTISGNTTTVLTEEDQVNKTAVTGGTVVISKSGTLTISGDSSELSKSSISGDGALTLKNTSLALTDDATLSGTKLTMQGANLTLGAGLNATTTGTDATTGTTADTTAADARVMTTVRTTALLADTAAKSYSVKSLNGDSSSKITLADSTLAVNGTGTSTYSGNIDGEGTLDVSNGTLILNNSGNDKLTLTVAKAKVTLNSASSSTKALRGASSNEISSKGITLNSGSELIVGTTSAADQVLSIGDGGLTLNSGSTLTFNLATEDETALDKLTLVTTTGAIALNSGSTVKLLNDDNELVSADEDSLKITLMTGGSAATVGNVTFQAAFLSTVYEDLTLQAEGNNVVLTGKARTESIFSPATLTPNATAGGDLLWAARKGIKNGDSLLKEAYLSVYNLIADGDKSGAARAMAAIAGSTVNSLGTAQRDSFRNQLAWVRNRTVTMGVDPDYTYDDLPYVHMWVEGTGASAQLNTDGDEGGYKLSSWGGTVGCDVDLTEHFTFGAALSAQFGTLSSSAAEYASGDLDSYYVSLFGRYQKKAWAHTVILTGSKSEGSLDRTVGFDTVSYSTQGSTDGSGFGAMYELTYDIPLNEEKSTIFQPLFNASIVKTSMKGYTETGADNAGLQVGKQDWTTATLALGARWLGLVGTNVFGREALVEVRANIAQDLGDNQGETKVALIGNPNATQTVYGAEVGKTAGQIGVGIYLPVGQQGTVFVNGNAEVRSGAHAINGSLGYRYSF